MTVGSPPVHGGGGGVAKEGKCIVNLAGCAPCVEGLEGSDDADRYIQLLVGRSFVSLLESLEISEKAAFNASSSGSSSSALAFICVVE